MRRLRVLLLLLAGCTVGQGDGCSLSCDGTGASAGKRCRETCAPNPVLRVNVANCVCALPTIWTDGGVP